MVKGAHGSFIIIRLVIAARLDEALWFLFTLCFLTSRSAYVSCRIPDRHRGQATAADSQHGVHVAGVGGFRQLCVLRVADAKSWVSGLGGGRQTRLDTAALRARLHDRSRSGHIANFVVIDWRALSSGVSRPRLEHQHQLQLLLRVRRDQALHGLSAGEKRRNS